jgi:hypothetical protein
MMLRQQVRACFGKDGKMTEFPRTVIEDLSVSRLVIGTNWFLGYSHTSMAKDRFIVETMTAKRIADVVEVFMKSGVDTLIGVRPDQPHLTEAIKDAEDRTGRKCITMGTPTLDTSGGPDSLAASERELDEYAALDPAVCMPHMTTTDALVDRCTRTIRDMDIYASMIRDRGMIPGLSTHMPESIIYADESGLDVATYVQPYNAAGFLMQIEVDWVHRVIWDAKNPVLTIKPLAAGRLIPLVGLGFAWATIRDMDMVSVGTTTPEEAAEVIEISLSLLERQKVDVELQRTRSKASVEKG